MRKSFKGQNTIAQLSKGSLKRVLGVSDLFAVGYGDLGSSIYYALGVTALYALGATPIALALAGLVFICTALTYAEMTSTYHESGGTASFVRHAFNDLISFISGWGLLLDYIVTIAISAFTVGPYLSYFYQDLKQTNIQIGFTVGLILVLLGINIIGVRQSTRMSLVLAGFAIVTQIVIIAIGAGWLFNWDHIVDHIRINVSNASWSPSWPDFWKGTAMAMIAYTGIESIAQLSAESKQPAKTAPRAIFITMVLLLLTYLGISLVSLSALSPQQLSTTYLEDPLAGIVSALPFATGVLSPWIGLLAAAILFVAANAGIVGASRLSFNMGEYYQLPRFFYRIHPRFRTPVVSLTVFAILGILVVIWSRGQMTFLADLYNFGAMLAFFSGHMSLIVLRIKQPHLKRPFRIPFNLHFGKVAIPISAIIGAFVTLGVWVLVVITKPEGRYLGFTWMGLGILMYLFYRRKERIKIAGQISIEKIKIPDFRRLEIKNILVPTRGGAGTETVQIACELAKIHGASLSVIHVIEVPPSIPIDTVEPHREVAAAAVLKAAEAIAREIGIVVDLQTVRSRSVYEALLETARTGKYDLLVFGATKRGGTHAPYGVGNLTEKVVRHAPCRVWVCTQ